MKAISTKFLPWTATKSSRIKAFDCDGNSITKSYSSLRGCDEGSHKEIAIALCEKWDGIKNF